MPESKPSSRWAGTIQCPGCHGSLDVKVLRTVTTPAQPAVFKEKVEVSFNNDLFSHAEKKKKRHAPR